MRMLFCPIRCPAHKLPSYSQSRRPKSQTQAFLKLIAASLASSDGSLGCLLLQRRAGLPGTRLSASTTSCKRGSARVFCKLPTLFALQPQKLHSHPHQLLNGKNLDIKTGIEVSEAVMVYVWQMRPPGVITSTLHDIADMLKIAANHRTRRCFLKQVLHPGYLANFRASFMKLRKSKQDTEHLLLGITGYLSNVFLAALGEEKPGQNLPHEVPPAVTRISGTMRP